MTSFISLANSTAPHNSSLGTANVLRGATRDLEHKRWLLVEVPLDNTYMKAGNNAPERIFSVQDLGVLFDHRLSFKDHISTITNKARSLLAFMKRWSREFDDPYTTKLLYVSLVRPSMEYCSCIWSLEISCYQNMLEPVQKQFLLFALGGLNWDTGSRLPSYHARLRLLDLPTLNHRRKCHGVMFLHKLINGDVDSPFLLSSFNWNVPCSSSFSSVVPANL